MKTKMLSCLLAAALCALLAGCGAKSGEPALAPDPAPQSDPAAPAQDEAQPETSAATPELEESQDAQLPEPATPVQDTVLPTSVSEPDAAPEPEETQDVQPEEPVLPEADGSDDISASYMGTWRNDSPGSMSNGRCSMEIDCEDGVNYDINIFWGSSSATARYWHFTGTYDETQAGIAYHTGIQFYGTSLSDGTIERTEETENEEGLIRLEDGVLYWEDMTGFVGDEMDFNRES